MKLPICPPDAELCRISVSRPGSSRARTIGRTSLGLAALFGVALVAIALSPSAVNAACTPTSPADDDDVECTGLDSTGYDGSGANNLTITTAGPALLTDADPGLDAAILVDDESSVTIGASATVRVTQQNGAGIRGDDDNFIENQGRIEIDADDARGISLDQNTTDDFSQGNGAINNGTIQVEGNRSYGIETSNAGVSTANVINLIGDETRGISAGSRTDLTKRANITNASVFQGNTLIRQAVINVDGDDSQGIKVGDDWIDGSFTNNVFVPSSAGVRNDRASLIRVSGDRSTGIFTGDESNVVGDHNSFVSNSGTITVLGTDSAAISVGGNDRLDRYDLSTVDLSDGNTFGLVSITNAGAITGAATSGPLVEFRAFVAGQENRLLNAAGGTILANTADQIAIRGSGGDELIINVGQIRGDIELGDGDDRYFHLAGAQQTGDLIGGIIGQDEVTLAGTRTAFDTYDLANLQGVEALRIVRGAPVTATSTLGSPFRLTNSLGFTGLVEIEDNGLLDVPTPITLGGALTVRDDGAIRVTLDGTTAPLTIQGFTNLDGKLIVAQGPNLAPSPTPYQVVLASGGYAGQFSEIEFPNATSTRVFTPSYDTTGLLVLFEDVGLVGAARGSNQRAVAQNLLDLRTEGGSTGDLQALLDQLNLVTNLPSVYTTLSPEPYDAQTTVSVEAGRHIAALLFDRPRDCQTGDADPWDPNQRVLPCHEHRFAPWAATLGSFRSRDAFDGHNRYDAQLGGLIAGVDVQAMPDLEFTFAVSSQRGSIDVATAGESTLTLAELTGAAVWSYEGLRIQGVATWGHGFHQDRRRVLVKDTAAPVDVRGTDDRESDRTLLATEIGYRVPVGPVGIEPLVGFDWAWMIQDEIQESGAGGFGLDVDDRDDQIGSVRAGVRLTSVYEHKSYLGPWLEWMTGIWRPSFDLAWREYVAGNERDLDARLQGSPGNVGGFTVQGKEDAGGAEIGVGFRFVPVNANRLRFDVRYQAYVAEHTLEQDLVGQVAITF